VEEFYFNKAPPKSPDSGTPPQQGRFETPTLPPDTESDSARRDFDFADRLGTRRAYQDFLDKHKTGPYADRAPDKLAKLEQPKKPDTPREEPEKKKQPEPDDDASKTPLIRELDRAIAKNPDDGDAHFKRGLAYAQNARYNQAIEDFGQVIRLNPKDPEAF